MGLPQKQRTRRSKRERSSHFALSKTGLKSCKDCGANMKPHVACPQCGAYKGNKVIAVAKRAARALRNKKSA